MKKSLYILEQRAGFSLIEVLAAMMIGTMILVAVFNVYDRAGKAAASVNYKLNHSRRPYEALQLIAEDFDKMINTNNDTSVIIINRYINNYAAAIFVYRVKYQDATNKEQTYKEYLWQCNQNPDGDPNEMVLYRSYEGVVPEDRLLDRDRDKSEKNVYIPICEGVTYFYVKIISEKERTEIAWGSGVPLGMTVTISFAKPFKDDKGNYDVPENEKYSRTITFDKGRKIKFDISSEEEASEDGIMMDIPDKKKS